jgi:hypothetical protein
VSSHRIAEGKSFVQSACDDREEYVVDRGMDGPRRSDRLHPASGATVKASSREPVMGRSSDESEPGCIAW